MKNGIFPIIMALGAVLLFWVFFVYFHENAHLETTKYFGCNNTSVSYFPNGKFWTSTFSCHSYEPWAQNTEVHLREREAHSRIEENTSVIVPISITIIFLFCIKIFNGPESQRAETKK